MSKSIYQEALEIMVKSILPRESNKTNKLKVIKALEQAQKQEKLLELYRCLDENANDYDLHYDKVDEIHNKIDEIEERIKEIRK